MKKNLLLSGLILGLGSLLWSDAIQAQAAHTMDFGTVAPAGTPWSDQLDNIKNASSQSLKDKSKSNSSWVVLWVLRLK